ncbi:MAG: hypothetical protein K0R65_1368 [Crocinitomicaceae bacterium]|jgi:hypothetical protein|nr:hypothetical protein [Crocinitomicaceae bacterium]
MQLGKDGLDSDAYLDSQAIDTFSLETYTYVEDSLVSSNLSTALLGSYNDPVTGKFESEIFTQFELSALSPDFGDVTTIHIDSFVLGIEYRGYYGSLDAQTFEVYRMTEEIDRDSTYYTFTTKAIDNSDDLVQTDKGTLVPDPTSPTIIDGKEVEAQLRLHLDTTLARAMITEAENNPATFSSNENFRDYFKGLNIKVNNPAQASGKGALLYFNLYDPLSKLTIYFTQDGQKKTFDFLLNDECANFNHITVNNSPAVQNVIDNPALGKNQFFAQGNKSRAVVKFTTINKIPKNAIIQYAKLELPVAAYTYDPFYPSLNITTATRINDSDENLYNLNQIGEYSSFRKNYEIDVRAYVQQLVNQNIENMGIYLSPAKMLSSGERIVFNGTSTTNKKQPKLKIIYTTY